MTASTFCGASSYHVDGYDEDLFFIPDLALQLGTRVAQAVRASYPGCPALRETIIAEHACRKYAGRVGRTRDAKELESNAIDLAVRAHIRHADTDYGRLLDRGVERYEARDLVQARVQAVIDR